MVLLFGNKSSNLAHYGALFVISVHKFLVFIFISKVVLLIKDLAQYESHSKFFQRMCVLRKSNNLGRFPISVPIF